MLQGTETEIPAARGGRADGEGREVAIIGGGITGLAAAHRLREIDPGIRVTVLEAGPRAGGVLRTVAKDGFLIESGADSFITTVPWGLDLCRRLGLEGRLIRTDPSRRRAFVVCRGRLEPIPDGLMIMAPGRLMPMATTRILSPMGKLRMAWEAFVPPGDAEDESLASFARRRFGREAYERLIQPLVGGMYTGDPERLSVAATMPRFLEMERSHGSLIRAVRSQGGKRRDGAPSGSGARYGLFVGLEGGMSELVGALMRRLPAGSVRCGVRVDGIRRGEEGRWIIRIEGDRPETRSIDAVIVAAPAREAARLLADVEPGVSEGLGQIASTGCAIVSLGYRREQVAHPLDGFGFVVPRVERRAILSGSFSSVKFPGRSPDGTVLLRVFLGGAHRPDLLDLDDDPLIATAEEELAALLGVRGSPILRHLDRWRGVMPQYHVGHLGLVRSIEGRMAALGGLELAGNAYHGVGVPNCIHSGEQAAGRIAARLGVASGPPTGLPRP